MVHIYTFCDKTLLGRKNLSAKILCEELYKLNLKMQEVCVFNSNYDFSSINFKNNDVYFLLLQKSSSVLNDYLASLSGDVLQDNDTLKTTIMEYFSAKNLPLEKSTELEWKIPSRATAITNPIGRIQGYIVEIGKAQIFVLPNEQTDLEKIYNDCLKEYLQNKFIEEYQSETFKTFGIGEEHIFSILKEQIKNKDKIYITITTKGLDADVVIKAKKSNEKFEEYKRIVYSKLEKFIYSVQDYSLIEYFVKEVKQQNLTFCVGGDVGVSSIVDQFPKEIYKNLLDVQIFPNKDMVSKYLSGNVDFEDKPKLAYDIAVKLLEKHNCDLVFICLDGSEKDDSGVSYIAVGNKIKIDIYKNKFYGSEKDIKEAMVSTTLFYLVKRLQQKNLKTI